MTIYTEDGVQSEFHCTSKTRNTKKNFNGISSSGSKQETTFKASNGIIFKMVVDSPSNLTPGNELIDFYKTVREAVFELRSYVRKTLNIKNGAKRDLAEKENISEQNDKQEEEIIENVEEMFPQLPHEGQRKINYEIFMKLCMKFPNIDENFIRFFCPQDWIPNISHDLQFTQIVKILSKHYAMSVINKLWREENEYEKSRDPTFEETFLTLLDYYPDAEPGYIRSVAESHYRNKEKLYYFIETSMENPTYPKKNFQDEPINFDVEEFLKIFPEPKKYFEDPMRKSNYNHFSYMFLLYMFKNHHPSTIQEIYCENYCNMSITARILSEMKKDVEKEYKREEPTTEKLPILHEISYIRHRHDIENFLEKEKQMERGKTRRLKIWNNLLVCQRCFDVKCIPSKVSQCQGGHIFCNSCFLREMNFRLEKNDINIKCLIACQREFDLETMEKLLDSWKFRRFSKAKQMDEIIAADVNGLVLCPFCQYATIPPPGDEVLKCLDPFCMIESCLRCKKPDHSPFLCKKV